MDDRQYGNKRLLDYQVVGRDFLKARDRALLADDMGLGKTLQTLSAAKDLGLAVHVVGPPRLILDWRNEAEALGVGLTYHSYAKVPNTVPKDCVLVFEEAHWLQSGERSARGRKGLRLALEGNQSRLWLLTGTPMRNGRPINLKPLLEALEIVPDVCDSWEYLKKFCDPQLMQIGRRQVYTYKGAENLDQLAELIAPVTLRRLKDDVLDLPPKIHIQRHLLVENKARVSQALKDFKLRSREAGIDSSAEKLLIVTQLKQLSELDKLTYCETLKEELDGKSTIWFCCYLESAHQLAKLLGCHVITGETSLETRQQRLEDFQKGTVNNLVLTIRAAGVGINLTQAESVVFLGKEWAPEDNAQAEDRAYRIGQTKRLRVYHLESSLDRHVVGLHQIKESATDEFMSFLLGY